MHAYEEFFQSIAKRTEKELKLAKDLEISITFVRSRTIHIINRDYRGIDRPTDVISFASRDGLEAFIPDEEKDLAELVGFIIEHLHLFLEDEEIINSLPEDSLKIATDMTVFGAKTDQVASEEDMGLWREYTSANFDLRMLDGEHTILYDNPEVIICEMKEVLNKGYEQ